MSTEIPSIAAIAIGLFVLQDKSYQVPISLLMDIAIYLYLQSMIPVDPDKPVYLSNGCTEDGTAYLY